jgi:putative heme-binding domain-containing protein
MHTVRIILSAFLLVGQLFAEDDSIALLIKTAKDSENPALRTALLKGMIRGLEGQVNVNAPEGWKELSAELVKSKDPEHRALAREIGQIFGDAGAAQEAMALLKDQKAKIKDRKSALKSLITQKEPGLNEIIRSLLEEPEIRIDAIRAFGKIEGADSNQLIKQYSDWDTQARRAVIETLATKKETSEALLIALQKKQILPSEIPAYTARTLHSLLGERFDEIYGKVQVQSTNKKELILKYSKLLDRPEAIKSDPARGRVVFSAVCGTCHKMYGEGGLLGPDLTGSNRTNREYILLNIVDPNFDVPDGYKMVIVKTKDNRVLAGTIGEEDSQKVVLKMVAGKEIIPKENIKERQKLPLSMMPEGILETIPTEDFFALIKYLQTEEQTELP